MAERLKSALELAMEKTKKIGGDEVSSLTSEQKDEIAQIRKVYEAKMAEVEILVQDKEKKEIDLDRLSIVPVQRPEIMFGMKLLCCSGVPAVSSASIAPSVSSGHSAKLRLALLTISMHAAWMSLGSPWPPNSTG